MIGPLICLSLEILNYLIKLQIPLLVNISFLFLSLFRLSNYFLEAKLISEGFYIKTEFLNFIVTILLYSFFIALIPQSSLEGFYILSLLNLMLYSFYGLLLFFFAKNLFKDGDKSSSRDLDEFTKSVLQSNFLFALGTRIDEFFAAFIFSPSLLGLFSKAKEIAIMLGTFSSKIISRPWYYVACNLDSRSIRLYHLCTVFLSFVVSYIAFSILQEGISIVIDFLGPNWSMLNEYSNIILGIFVLYFLVIFSNSSLLALGREKKLLQIDKLIILIRVFSYSILFLLLVSFDMEVEIFMILYLDLVIRVINFILQLLLLVTKNIDTDMSIEKEKHDSLSI
jgi:hypothetical protein